MKATDVINYYGTAAEAARALGITRGAVNQWKAAGVVPKRTAALIALKLNGAIPFGAEDYPEESAANGGD